MEIDIERIEAEIERLKTLNADEYLAEKFAELKEEFEQTRAEKIAKLEEALSIFEEYQVVEDEEEDDEEEEEDAQQVAQTIEE